MPTQFSSARSAKKLLLVAGVSAASIVVGGIAGVGATILVSVNLFGPLIPWELLTVGTTAGIGVGLVSGPLIAFTLLRHEPIGISLLRSLVGALVGGILGVWSGLDAINPYDAVTFFRAPMWQAALGAINGAVALALIARWRRSRAARGTD